MPDKEKADKRQSLNSNSDATIPTGVSSIPKRNNSALNAGHRPVSLIVTGDLTAPPSPNPAVRKRQPQNFEFLDILGEGSYATVQLANEIETGKTFAIKILDKAHIVKEKKVKYVNLEKVVFNKLHGSPCFVKLYYTFQDPAKLYFVLSYAENGELLHYIRKLGSFDLECAKWYAAEMVVAIEYMHGMGIIHRDLKPENILLSKDMHIKITDFGTSKILNDDGSANDSGVESDADGSKTSSFVGTAEYVSPELLKDKKTSTSSDIWALGCIIYQLIAGKVPFKGSNEYQTLQKVMKAELEYPPGFPEVARDLITKLLVVEPEKRLGHADTGGYAALKAHPFFEGIDWENIMNMTPPELRPYLPSTTVDAEGLSSQENAGGDGVAAHQAVIPSDSEWSLDDSEKEKEIDPAALEEERRQALEKQKKENQWAQFVRPDELIVYTSPVYKRRGFFSKYRQLILTDTPRLIYVSIDKMAAKGEIPWNKDLKPELKNTRNFFVHTPHRTYYLEDPAGRAATWANQLNNAMIAYRKKLEENTTPKT